MSVSGVAISFQMISGNLLAALRPTEVRTLPRVSESSEYMRVVIFPSAPSYAAGGMSAPVGAFVSLVASSVIDGLAKAIVASVGAVSASCPTRQRFCRRMKVYLGHGLTSLRLTVSDNQSS